MFCEFVHIAFLLFDYFWDLLKNSCFCPPPSQIPFRGLKGARDKGKKKTKSEQVRVISKTETDLFTKEKI